MKRMILIAALLGATPCAAGTFTVNAADNIYGAGQTSAPGGGNVPTAIQKIASTAVCVTVRKVTGSMSCGTQQGCIEINQGTGDTPNDADGVGSAASTSSNVGTSLISGITAPYAGYLVGLFTKKDGPSGDAPPPLDFTTGDGTGFTTLSPELDQTFFIGDGETGDYTGTTQAFMVPAGARKLYLAISDACGYNGPPGCYNDNVGTFSVKLRVHKGTCSAAALLGRAHKSAQMTKER